jgi:hypothetical protein
MDKNTKMLLGVGAVAVVGYLVYQQMNKPKGFMNLTAPNPAFMVTCGDGTTFRIEQNGSYGADCTKHGNIKSIKRIQ